ncbi:MAG: septum formation protein Maf [Lysinibacillus sp.]|nr:septum formation protein Maf [Lysinibacillus sp.]
MKFNTQQQLVLASASPRRKELFLHLGVPFEVITSNVEETSVQGKDFKDYVQKVALLKSQDVASRNPGKTVIGADTIVVFNNELLHKPKTREEAIEHLEKLSSNKHEVMTAVAIITKDRQAYTFVEVTNVYFKKLSKTLIEKYVDTKDPFDKAGGYGIQTGGALFIDRIEGDYNTVVGLPIATLFEKLVELEIISL